MGGLGRIGKDWEGLGGMFLMLFSGVSVLLSSSQLLSALLSTSQHLPVLSALSVLLPDECFGHGHGFVGVVAVSVGADFVGEGLAYGCAAHHNLDFVA